MTVPANSLNSPRFLEANDVNELQDLMLQNNIMQRTEFSYFNIGKQGRKWYAWFYFDHRKLKTTINEE